MTVTLKITINKEQKYFGSEVLNGKLTQAFEKYRNLNILNNL